MANRSYLYTRDSGVRYVDLTWPLVVSAFDYGIPVFWFMLFDESNIVESSTSCDDGTDFHYYRFESDKTTAVRRAKENYKFVVGIMGVEVKEVFDIWISHMEETQGNLVIAETCELAMMHDPPDAFKSHLADCISIFSHSSDDKDKIQALLSQSELQDTSSPVDYKLCGYAWESPVPWDGGT